ADQVGELGLAAWRSVEGRLPMPEGAVAVGHRLELQGGDVALQGHCRVENAVGRQVLGVGQSEQLLAGMGAIAQMEIAHTTHLVGRLAVLDAGIGYGGMPAVMTVEVPQHLPDALDRRIDDGGAHYSLHGVSDVRSSS